MGSKLILDDIGFEYRKLTSIHEYRKQNSIIGVSIVELRHFPDDRGSFLEIDRIKEDGELSTFPGFFVKQINWSEILPGVIKAGHFHLNQDDVWYLAPSQRLLIGLIDARKDSETYNFKQRFVLGGGKANLLYIPKGVIHGVANIWAEKAYLIYFANQWWSAERDKTDEYRVPSEVFGDDFWKIQKC